MNIVLIISLPLVFFFVGSAFSQSACLRAPALPLPAGKVVYAATESALQLAITHVREGTTIIIAPGKYQLTKTLYVRKNNVTIRGEDNTCDGTILIGKGMENKNFDHVPHGIWTDAVNLKVQNLTIRSVFHHPIQFSPNAESPYIYNVRLLDAGEQFIKGSSGGYGRGVDHGIVEYTIMEYLTVPPNIDHGGGIGYTNGIDIHGGRNWIIRNNLFRNFHTPDTARHIFNPAILMWNGAQGTVTENNIFINVDRAVAYGLVHRAEGPDHWNGLIRNNFFYQRPGLFSSTRRAESDGLIIIWDSPTSQVVHNTILTNNNSTHAIQFRWNTEGSQAHNNLADANIHSRDGAQFTQAGNLLSAKSHMFIDPANANLHLKSTAAAAIDVVSMHPEASRDIDGHIRPQGKRADVGADEHGEVARNNGTTLSHDE